VDSNARRRPAEARDSDEVVASARNNAELQRQLDEALKLLERGNLGTPLLEILRQQRERSA
jgi:hypothetical protein